MPWRRWTSAARPSCAATPPVVFWQQLSTRSQAKFSTCRFLKCSSIYFAATGKLEHADHWPYFMALRPATTSSGQHLGGALEGGRPSWPRRPQRVRWLLCQKAALQAERVAGDVRLLGGAATRRHQHPLHGRLHIQALCRRPLLHLRVHQLHQRQGTKSALYSACMNADIPSGIYAAGIAPGH